MQAADQQLSPHFRLSEFLVSQEATRWGIDNTPTPAIVANLERVAMALEGVRVLLCAAPIVISSGYRCPTLNARVNGAHDSAHLDGRAADFTAPGFGSPLEICRRLAASGVEFDQLIFEHGWVHVGLAPVGAKPRREVLTAIFHPGEKTEYAPGLPA